MLYLILVIGLLGMILILIGFILEEFSKRITRDSVNYNLLNISGSGLLVIYAYLINGIPFLILNSIWFLVALTKLYKIVTKRIKPHILNKRLKKKN